MPERVHATDTMPEQADHPPLPPGAGARIARRGRRLARRMRQRVLRRARERESALLVSVPAADPVIERARAAHELPAQRGVPAHVTLLYPFAPVDALDHETERVIAAVVNRFAQFRFRLEEVGRFPGNIHLVPNPAAPFVRLTEALAAQWPEYPRYGGAYDAIVPHVTVVESDGPSGLAETLAPELPLEAVAEHVDLVVEDGDRLWSWRARFPLGG